MPLEDTDTPPPPSVPSEMLETSQSHIQQAPEVSNIGFLHSNNDVGNPPRENPTGFHQPNLKVGGKVRYTGHGEHGLSTLRAKGLWTDVLSIESINGEYATVRLPRLVATQTIELKHLRRA